MKLSVIILALLGVLLVEAGPLCKKSENYEMIPKPRDLQDDLDDFLSLIPKDKIEDLFYDYLAEDEDFAEALDYVLSDDVKNLVTEVESIPELKKFLNYLQKAGLDAFGFVNKINDALGINRIQSFLALKSNVNKISGGLPGFIKDIEALLPTDKIQKMYYQKLKSSSAFAALVRQLQSKEFQGLVDKIIANAKLQQAIKKAEAKGVDVQAIFDLITSFFGIKFPPRPLFVKEEEEVAEIMKQIWAHVPMDNLTDLIITYVTDDEDFQDLVAYMLSEDFRNTQADIEKMSEFVALAKYLDSLDLSIYEWINSFNDLIGLPPFKSLDGDGKITGGLAGFIKDVRAMLPIKELYEFYDEKFKSSSKFREFVKRLETGELQMLVTALGKHKGFNTWLKKLQERGVDLDELVEIIQGIIGIKFPKPGTL